MQFILPFFHFRLLCSHGAINPLIRFQIRFAGRLIVALVLGLLPVQTVHVSHGIVAVAANLKRFFICPAFCRSRRRMLFLMA